MVNRIGVRIGVDEHQRRMQRRRKPHREGSGTAPCPGPCRDHQRQHGDESQQHTPEPRRLVPVGPVRRWLESPDVGPITCDRERDRLQEVGGRQERAVDGTGLVRPGRGAASGERAREDEVTGLVRSAVRVRASVRERDRPCHRKAQSQCDGRDSCHARKENRLRCARRDCRFEVHWPALVVRIAHCFPMLADCRTASDVLPAAVLRILTRKSAMREEERARWMRREGGWQAQVPDAWPVDWDSETRYDAGLRGFRLRPGTT